MLVFVDVLAADYRQSETPDELASSFRLSCRAPGEHVNHWIWVNVEGVNMRCL